MILTCPACTTRYLVDPSALGTDGRQVRCARCKHTWHAEPIADEAVKAEPASAEPSFTARSAEENEDEAAAAGLAATRRRSARAQLPAVREEKSSKLWIAWLLLLLVVAGIVAGGYIYRSQIIEIWPPSGKLYRTIGIKVEPPFRLRIPSFKYDTQTENAKTVIIVTGSVINEGKFPQAIPPVRVTLYDANGREVAHWTAPIGKSVLRPGEEVPFTTKLSEPPSTAQRLGVTFSE